MVRGTTKTKSSSTESRRARERKEREEIREESNRVRTLQSRRDDALRLDLDLLKNARGKQKKQVAKTYRSYAETERRVKYEQYLEKCRCTPHLHSAPWQPTHSFVGKPFATAESLAIGSGSKAAATKRFPRRPFTASTRAEEQRRFRKPWAPPNSQGAVDNILHDPRTARPMTARPSSEYEKILSKRKRKPRPFSSKGHRSETRKSKSTRDNALDNDASLRETFLSLIPDGSLHLPWYNMSVHGRATYVEKNTPHRPSSRSNTGVEDGSRRMTRARQCFNSPRMKQAFQRIEEERLDESRAQSGLDGGNGGMVSLSNPLYSSVSQLDQRGKDIKLSFEESRASAREGRVAAQNAVLSIVDRWIKAERADEYKQLQGEILKHANKLGTLKAQADQLEEKMKGLRVQEENRAKAFQCADKEMIALREKEAAFQIKMEKADSGLNEAAASLVAPILASLNGIHDSENSNNVFTAETIKGLIPEEPPTTQLPSTGSNNKQDAKAQKKKKKNKPNLRSPLEIVLTGLLLVIEPKEYSRQVLQMSSGNNDVTTFEEENDSDAKIQKCPLHSAARLLESTPYQLCDDANFHKMPLILHQIGKFVFQRVVRIEDDDDTMAAKKLKQLLLFDDSSVISSECNKLFQKNDGRTSGIGVEGIKSTFAQTGTQITVPECREIIHSVQRSGADSNKRNSRISEEVFVLLVNKIYCQNAVPIVFTRDTVNSQSSFHSPRHRFFDPLPKPWQVKELIRILGGPFEKNVKLAESLDPDYTSLREAALKILCEENSWKNGEKEEFERNPLFHLLCYLLSLLKLWREIYNNKSGGSAITQQNLREISSIREGFRDQYYLELKPLREANVIKFDKCEKEYRDAVMNLKIVEEEFKKLATEIEICQKCIYKLNSISTHLTNLNLTDKRLRGDIRDKNEELMSKWESPKSIMNVLLKSLRRDLRLQDGGGEAVLTVNFGGALQKSCKQRCKCSTKKKDTCKSCNEAYQLIDSAAVYLRLVTKIVSPFVSQFGGVILSSASSGAGAIDATSDYSSPREIHIHFPKVESEHIEKLKRRQVKSLQRKGGRNRRYMTKLNDLLKAGDALQRAVAARNSMIQELHRLPSIKKRLGKVDFIIQSKYFQLPQMCLPTKRFLDFGLAGCVFSEEKPRLNDSMCNCEISGSRTHPLYASSTQKSRKIRTHGMFSSFGKIPAFDRDRDDLALCQNLLLIGVEQEIEGTADGEGEDACSVDYPGHKAVNRIRDHIASSNYIQNDLSVLVVRLSHKSKGLLASKSTSLDTNFDNATLAPLSCKHLYSAVESTNFDQNSVMSSLLVGSLFSKVTARTLRQYSQGNRGHPDASSILINNELEGQKLNPIRLYACADTGALMDLASMIRRTWMDSLKFEAEGETQTAKKLRSLAKSYVLQQVLLRKGTILANNPTRDSSPGKGEEALNTTPSINRLSSSLSKAIAFLLRKADSRTQDALERNTPYVCVCGASAMNNLRMRTYPPWSVMKVEE